MTSQPGKKRREAELPDHAADADTREIPIDRVGIRGLTYPIRVMDRAAGYQHTVAEVSLTVGLPAHIRGTHMSRLVEVLDAARGEITLRNIPDILVEVQRKLEADDAHLEVSFPYFLPRRAPVSGVESLMSYPCRFEASRRGDVLDFALTVRVPVKSLCPCSKAVSRYGAHNQRSLVDVTVRSDTFVWIEQVVECVEGCASSPLYALLKREDEKYVTEHAYENPRFVEDLVREVLLAIRALPGVREVTVAAENLESIHNHSAYATLVWKRDEVADDRAHVRVVDAGGESESFGAWLKHLRQLRRMSQQELATTLGVSASWLCRVEQEDKAPSAEMLERIAEALGQDPMKVQLRAGVLPDALRAEIARRPDEFLRWAGMGT